MSFQSYLFSSNFKKLINAYGPCYQINISNISNKLLNDRYELCKFLSKNDIQINVSGTIDSNVSKIPDITNNLLNYIENNIDADIDTDNEKVLGKIVDISSLYTVDTPKGEDIIKLFSYNSGIKSVFSSQIIKLFEICHCNIRLKSLAIDKILLYTISYIRSLKVLNMQPTEQLKSNLEKLKRFLKIIKILDSTFELEYKQLLSSFNVFNSIYYNIHSSGYTCTSDIFNDNKNFISNVATNLFSVLYIVVLTFVMFIMLAIISCFKILGYKNHFLELKSIQTGTKISKIVSNMS